ncbi:23S rRNA methyltransferase [Candidatus Phytoplasma luffae]|uniref:23S rRNA methyltransferase n=1 Tax=Loofah witches'-broom phytoplasma TaxID=35773 RepID=A0A975IM17_LOWBP|nr:RNA methyltransferase [Candidatus Phytoplasma luffae]QTX02659.1 23S rRNA methyltransferase [Candidatus Phytoplasma luffae]
MIISKNNPQFKKLKKLSFKKYRDLYQEFLVFGNHLVEEALKAKIVLELYTTSLNGQGTLISENLMKELNNNKIIYKICAVCKKNNKSLESDKILVLDDIQDPGNAGTLLRSACAFGFKHVLSSNKTVDFYNEKTIQSSQGAIFNLFLEKGEILDFLTYYKNNNYLIFSTSVNKKNINLKEISTLDKKIKKILILGNEGSGISDSVQQKSDYFISIDTSDCVESLNVGVAGSIIMHLLK